MRIFFTVLPGTAWSIKVGLGKMSLTKFYIESMANARLLLCDLAKESGDIRLIY